ncbi:helix-turn-helix domain-containing protein [Streptomyces halobius]|uniref:Helix-turn-helix domain-containing protein n=1 Tax=Streptomyces halobius TaxID=2879846 RepID=A0ABY4M189_9ACTN|nr:helix-turn-helix transcriptional regulator [Streptomyces halobius]UQA91043.1 helix-turn-helix domain-containing protein [Streptomyces halobius]UQA91521.1 helix-turn-helix domain-containing protein [Streptomyces halobius]
MRNIEQAARIAIVLDRWNEGDADERYDAVLYAITEHLLTTDTPPTARDLVRIGLRASNRHVETEMHHRGYDPRNLAAGSGALPGFLRYWQHTGRVPWDERLVEAVALAQIWPLLTPLQQQAVTALALTGDHQAAADSLGVGMPTHAARLHKARLAVAALWHEHETPRRPARDKRVLARSGHYRGRRLLTEQDLEALRDRRAEGATLRELAAETGYSAGALCNLLRGKRRPAAAVVGGEAV